MAITSQAKVLKEALVRVGAVGRNGKVSVRTERTYVGKGVNGKSLYEFGSAAAHLETLSVKQVSQLKEISEWFEINNYPEHGFAIVRN